MGGLFFLNKVQYNLVFTCNAKKLFIFFKIQKIQQIVHVLIEIFNKLNFIKLKNNNLLVAQFFKLKVFKVFFLTNNNKIGISLSEINLNKNMLLLKVKKIFYCIKNFLKL